MLGLVTVGCGMNRLFLCSLLLLSTGYSVVICYYVVTCYYVVIGNCLFPCRSST